MHRNARLTPAGRLLLCQAVTSGSSSTAPHGIAAMRYALPSGAGTRSERRATFVPLWAAASGGQRWPAESDGWVLSRANSPSGLVGGITSVTLPR